MARDLNDFSQARLLLLVPQRNPVNFSQQHDRHSVAALAAHFHTVSQYHCVLQALVDRPDETRRVVSFKRLALTDFKIDIPRLAKKTALKAALEESGGHTDT